MKPPAETSDWSGLQQPFSLPPLPECIVDGDRVTVVVDPDTPQLMELVAEVVHHLTAGTAAPVITLLLPPHERPDHWETFQEQLPLHLRERISCHVHSPADEQQRSYLASSSGGERIYLSNHLTDADLIVSVGTVRRDPRLGYRGTNSALYPAFADQAAITASRQSVPHDHDQPQTSPRELVDEIGWLLGTQFCVQAVPASDGSVAKLFCGVCDQVQQQAQQWLEKNWHQSVAEPVELAVLSIPQTMAGYEWKHLGLALAALEGVVEEDARVAVVAELPAELSNSVELLRRCDDPADLLKPLKLDTPPDALETIQLIEALQRWKVFLLSGLSAETVEDLGAFALENEQELQRLVDAAASVLIVPSASYAHLSLPS